MDPSLAYTAIYLQFFKYFLAEELFGAKRHLGMSDEEPIAINSSFYIRGDSVGPISVAARGLFLFAVGSAEAQPPTTGQITGIVKDPNGAVINEARITLTSAAGVQREVASDVTGLFAFSMIPPGIYRVEAKKNGFSKTTAENVIVRITEITSLDIQLEVAAQKAVVEVMAAPPLVQTECSSGHSHRAGANPPVTDSFPSRISVPRPWRSEDSHSPNPNLWLIQFPIWAASRIRASAVRRECALHDPVSFSS